MRMNLNRVVQEYKISKQGGVRELRMLQKSLSDVPVSLNKFEEFLKINFRSELADLITRAELCSSQVRGFSLIELLSETEEADSIEERMILPYPIIRINGESVSERFYGETGKHLGGLILPDENCPVSGKGAFLMPGVLFSPDYPAVAIVYKEKDKVHYIEIVLTQDKL